MDLSFTGVGDPITHRRALGPWATKRLERGVQYVDEPWRRLSSLVDVAQLDQIWTYGALCEHDDVDAAVTRLRQVVAPGGRVVFLEHIGRGGALGALQRASETVYPSTPGGCHVRHDVHAALRRNGFEVDQLDRIAVPSLVPLLRHWVRGVARSRP